MSQNYQHCYLPRAKQKNWSTSLGISIAWLFNHGGDVNFSDLTISIQRPIYRGTGGNSKQKYPASRFS